MVIFYFSGTGNSQHIARLLAEGLDAECHSIEEGVDFGALMSTHDTIGFCYPVHGSRVPRIMREFTLKHLRFLENKKLILLCTQLIFSGDGSRAFTDMLPRNYVDVIYAEHIIMPNNVCNLFILPLAKREKQRACVARAEQQVLKIHGEIKSGLRRKRGFNLVSRVFGLIQGVFFPAFERSGLDKVWMDDDCIKCLLCVSLCPMKNIRFENNRLITKANCTICCRCINACPEKAIAIFFRTKVKKQYEGVEVVFRD